MRKKARKPVNYVASTIYVTPAQHDYLRRRAYEERRTAAEIIRELVARDMEVAHMEQISRNIYGAIHNWYMQYRETGDTRSGFSFPPTCNIYYDPDTQSVRAVSSGADYPGIRVLDNVQASDFLADDDDPATYTKDEFIDACMTAHGNVEIPEMNSKQEGWLDQVAATILRLANGHLNEVLANENMATEAYKAGDDKDGAVYKTIANFHREAVREFREVLDTVFEQGPDTDVDKDMDVQDRIIKRLQTMEETIREDKERNQFLNGTYADGILYGLRLAVDAVTTECTQVREH